jgi:hypothetical protein
MRCCCASGCNQATAALPTAARPRRRSLTWRLGTGRGQRRHRRPTNGEAVRRVI